MAGDLEKPVSTDAYETILQVIRDNFADLITSLEFGDPANLPTGAKRINSTSKAIERWSGAAWVSWASYQQVADMTTAATANKGALRDSSGRIKAAAGVASDDVLTVGQYTAADVFAKVLTQDGKTSGLVAQEAAAADVATKVGVLNVKVIDIGDWSMDNSNLVTVSHGVTVTKIMAVSVLIRNDTNDAMHHLSGESSSNAGWIEIVGTAIGLNRAVGGFFDSAAYDLTSYNRGWVTIWYVD
jgi:hypothetical protein